MCVCEQKSLFDCECVVALREGERGGEGRGAGLSSCALSIFHDLTLRKTEEGKVDRSERERESEQDGVSEFSLLSDVK